MLVCVVVGGGDRGRYDGRCTRTQVGRVLGWKERKRRRWQTLDRDVAFVSVEKAAEAEPLFLGQSETRDAAVARTVTVTVTVTRVQDRLVRADDVSWCERRGGRRRRRTVIDKGCGGKVATTTLAAVLGERRPRGSEWVVAALVCGIDGVVCFGVGRRCVWRRILSRFGAAG